MNKTRLNNSRKVTGQGTSQCLTVAQLRTGHSPLLAAYLHRIGRRDSATCPHCNGAEETAEHLVFQCPAHDQARRQTLPEQRVSTDPRRAGGRTPRALREGPSGRGGLMLRMEKNVVFNVINRPHKTKSWLRHWILFINTHSAVSQIQSIRQILPLSLDIPMLKSSQLQGGFATLTRGYAPGPRWGVHPRPTLHIKHGVSQ